MISRALLTCSLPIAPLIETNAGRSDEQLPIFQEERTARVSVRFELCKAWSMCLITAVWSFSEVCHDGFWEYGRKYWFFLTGPEENSSRWKGLLELGTSHLFISESSRRLAKSYTDAACYVMLHTHTALLSFQWHLYRGKCRAHWGTGDSITSNQKSYLYTYVHSRTIHTSQKPVNNNPGGQQKVSEWLRKLLWSTTDTTIRNHEPTFSDPSWMTVTVCYSIFSKTAKRNLIIQPL